MVFQSSRVALVCVVLAFLFARAAEAETYYGHNLDNNGKLTLVALPKGPVTWTLSEIPGGRVVQQGELQPAASLVVELGGLRDFKLTTSSPLLSMLGLAGALAGGTNFFPQEDGRSYWGNRSFVFTETTSTGLTVFSRDAADVEIFDQSGQLIDRNVTMPAESKWYPQGLIPGKLYTVLSRAPLSTPKSKALISVQGWSYYSGNTTVPPVPSVTSVAAEDCNSDLGTNFVFHLHTALALFNPSATDSLTFSMKVFEYGTKTPIPAYQNVIVEPQTTYFNASFLEGDYEIITTRPATVWAGDIEGPYGVGSMGDDSVSTLGSQGRSFFTHSQSDGATLFAFEDDTSVTYSSAATALASEIPPTTVVLSADQTLSLAPLRTFSVTSSHPVSIQSFGGPWFNDWSVILRPAQKLDTDNNGLTDFEEGGSCSSSAPDTDQDGVADFADTDDDNDCVLDALDSNRLSKSLPSANPNDNCVAPFNTCVAATGTCTFEPADSGQPDASPGVTDAGTDAGVEVPEVTPDAGNEPVSTTNEPQKLEPRFYRIGCDCSSGIDLPVALSLLTWVGARLARANRKRPITSQSQSDPS
jgi:hypothetical protein